MSKPKITVVNHPMALEQLTLVRNKQTSQITFRKSIFRIGRLLAYEFLRTLEAEEFEVETPLRKTKGYRVKGQDKIVIIMVLRAAIPLVEGMYKMLPLARAGIISAWRGKAPEFRIDVSYSKIPTIHGDDVVIIADPMIATGHTLREVAKIVVAKGKPKRLVFFSVIATMRGIEHVRRDFPDAEFYTTAIDPVLNDHGYIEPGLGDAGDRSFGSPV